MKNKLQYIYSIGVFFGVLFSSYLMIDKESNARIPVLTYQGPYYRTEAVVMDPALSQLFEIENQLSPSGKGKLSQEKLEKPDSEQDLSIK